MEKGQENIGSNKATAQAREQSPNVNSAVYIDLCWQA